jgi:hypothetical protein
MAELLRQTMLRLDDMEVMLSNIDVRTEKIASRLGIPSEDDEPGLGLPPWINGR